MKKLERLVWGILCLSAVAVAVFSLRYFTHPETVPLLKLRGGLPRTSLLIHALGGIMALATGPFQFSTRLRACALQLHRRLGYVFSTGVAVGGLAGLYSATVTMGGLSACIGFAALALLWLGTAGAALVTVRRRNIAAHREWMLRCFALTLAAVTLRIWLPLLEGATGSFDEAYRTVAWLSWVPNLIVAELWIHRTARPTAAAAAAA